jgi:hypothetical protein
VLDTFLLIVVIEKAYEKSASFTVGTSELRFLAFPILKDGSNVPDVL